MMARVAVAAFVMGLTGVAGARAAHADEVKVSCDFYEISATKGTAVAIDSTLTGKLAKKLKKPLFAKQWQVYKLLSSTTKSLGSKKAETIALKSGSSTATLVEVVDKSKVRMTLTMADAHGKQILNVTSVVEAGDYLIGTVVLPSEEGHLLAVTCK